MGYRFKCRYCPKTKRYKTNTSRKTHKDKSCIEGRTRAGGNRHVYAPAFETENEEEEMIINGEDTE